MKIVHTLSDNEPKELHKQFFVFDVETRGLSPKPENFIFAVLYGYKFKKVFYKPKDLINEFKKVKYKGKKIFAHNAEYDLSSTFGNVILDIDNSAIFNGKFISCKFAHTTFCDSFSIFPSSVKKIGETIGLKKLDIDENYITGKNVKITNKMIDYCTRDCEIVFQALLKMFEKVGCIRMTIASLAMAYFRKKFLKKPLIYNEFNVDFFESYYGGRTEVFKLGSGNYKVLDINSLYPFIMSDIEFPDPKNLKKIIKVDLKYFKYLLTKKEGYAKVRINHSSEYFGYLPFKGKVNGSSSNKLLFPVGEFTTCVNFNELRYALSQGVIQILEVEYCVYSNPIKSPFSEYVTHNYNERVNSENELTKLIIKLLLNSLYGKFGMREKYTTQYYSRIPHKKIQELKNSNTYYELKLFSSERSDCYLITENNKTKKSFFAIPSFASYITSAARVYLLKEGLIKNENVGIAYCDTDSIFVPVSCEPSVPLGSALGEFKLEEKTVTDIRGLKNYSYIDNEGKKHDAIKGVSKNSEKISKNKYKALKFYKTKEAIRRQKVTGDNFYQEKELKHVYDKREILKNGETKPLKL